MWLKLSLQLKLLARFALLFDWSFFHKQAEGLKEETDGCKRDKRLMPDVLSVIYCLQTSLFGGWDATIKVVFMQIRLVVTQESKYFSVCVSSEETKHRFTY